jgi:hypothetical protein
MRSSPSFPSAHKSRHPENRRLRESREKRRVAHVNPVRRRPTAAGTCKQPGLLGWGVSLSSGLERTVSEHRFLAFSCFFLLFLLTILVYSCLFLFILVYSCLFLFILAFSCFFLLFLAFLADNSCLFLFILVYSCLFLFILVYSCLFLFILAFSCFFLLPPASSCSTCPT